MLPVMRFKAALSSFIAMTAEGMAGERQGLVDACEDPVVLLVSI